MLRRFVAALAATAVTFAAAAQNGGETVALLLWDNASAPHSNGAVSDGQSLQAHDTAELFVYAPEEQKRLGVAVVVCPGGGYEYLSLENEGSKVAQWLADNGITAAVLKYRLPYGHPEVPLEDAVQALKIMRGEFHGADSTVIRKMQGLTCACTGVAGFSAGGHLAAMLSTMGESRPDFSILFYPVITGETGLCHAGSFDNLLGRDRTARLTAAYSLENRVDAKTPPAIILVSDDDRGVPPISSTRYYNALKEHDTPASLHIYPAGGHGWGMRGSFPWYDNWQAAVLEWIGRFANNEN